MAEEKTNVEKCLVLLNSSDKDKIKSGLQLVKSFDEQQLVSVLLIYKMDDQGKLILDKNWSEIFCELFDIPESIGLESDEQKPHLHH